MDPQATWAELVEAYERYQNGGAWEDVDDRVVALQGWLDRGGFPPKVTGCDAFDRFLLKTLLDALASWELTA